MDGAHAYMDLLPQLDLIGAAIRARGQRRRSGARASPELAASMSGCAGLRNPIAHACGTLDMGRMYDERPAGRDALAGFAAEAAKIPGA